MYMLVNNAFTCVLCQWLTKYSLNQKNKFGFNTVTIACKQIPPFHTGQTSPKL